MVLQTHALPLGYCAVHYIILSYFLKNASIFSKMTPTGIEPVLPP